MWIYDSRNLFHLDSIWKKYGIHQKKSMESIWKSMESIWKKYGIHLKKVQYFTLPGLIHMESMEWGVDCRNSRWIPWNGGWIPYFWWMDSMEWGMDSMTFLMDSMDLPIYCSMDIMDSMWNDHGMVMESISILPGFH